jgi:hypothetical protein
MPFHDLHIVLPADVPYQISRPRHYLSGQRWPSIPRDAHQMQMNLKYGVRAVAILWHLPSVICGALAEAVA